MPEPVAPAVPTAPPPSRVALVTGAGRGLGRHVAAGLAERGQSVGLLGRRPEPLQELAAQIAAGGGAAAVVVADVRDAGAVQRAVAEVEAELGPIDLLVNNAGVIESVEVPLWQADPQEWWDVIETDLRGPVNCVRAVVPGMIARGGGRVVDLASGSGIHDQPVYSAYSAAKAALMRVGGHLHVAGAELGLRAFEVAPGVVRSDMTGSMAVHENRTDWTPPQGLVTMVAAIAGGRLDAWSGCYLHAGVDDPDQLATFAPGAGVRRLGVHGHGPLDRVAACPSPITE